MCSQDSCADRIRSHHRIRQSENRARDNSKTQFGGQERSLLLLQTQMSLEIKIGDNKPPKVGLQGGQGGVGDGDCYDLRMFPKSSFQLQLLGNVAIREVGPTGSG